MNFCMIFFFRFFPPNFSLVFSRKIERYIFSWFFSLYLPCLLRYLRNFYIFWKRFQIGSIWTPQNDRSVDFSRTRTWFFSNLYSNDLTPASFFPEMSLAKRQRLWMLRVEKPVLTWLTSLFQIMVLWVPTSMEHLLYVVATLLVHITKHVTNSPMLDGKNLPAWMKKEHLQLESCTRTNSIVLGGYDGSSRLQTSEIISIDGAVEYGPELPRSSCCHWWPYGPYNQPPFTQQCHSCLEETQVPPLTLP